MILVRLISNWVSHTRFVTETELDIVAIEIAKSCKHTVVIIPETRP